MAAALFDSLIASPRSTVALFPGSTADTSIGTSPNQDSVQFLLLPPVQISTSPRQRSRSFAIDNNAVLIAAR